MNLVTNASEAIGNRDGVIRLTTRPATEQRAAEIFQGVGEGLKVIPGAGYVEPAVSDTGAGMTPETRARVFDPFFTTKSAGRGMGLSVVHGIVRSLGGAICIASEPVTGTTVYILLPCVEAVASVTINAASVVAGNGLSFGKLAVLVVEDEDPLRQAVVKTLRREGFEVYETSNGSTAIDLLRHGVPKIDLMLLDVTIPGATLPEVVAEAARLRPDMKVIVTSAYSREKLTDELNAPQVCAFIRKPFRLTDLVKMLQEAVLS